jgi:SpoIID/LytB domain protein
MIRIRFAVVIVGAMLVSQFARAQDDLSHRDEIATLYSGQFQFAKDGQPILTVRIAEGLDNVRIWSASPFTIASQSNGGVEIPVSANRPVRFRLIEARASKSRTWIVAARVSGTKRAMLAGVLDTWRRRGFDPRLFELGAIFGASGQTVDKRSTIVALKSFDSEADAEREAAPLFSRYGLKPAFHPEIVAHPRGRFEIVGDGGDVIARMSDVAWVAATGPMPIEVAKVEYAKGYAWHGFADRAYRGRIYVTIDRAGKLAVVNAVPIESYLRGVIPSEIHPKAPDEALKAQAVAARGEALAKVGHRHIGDPFLLCAEQHCQVYSGTLKESAGTDRAIAATRGEVLMSAKGLVDTVYSANCGGHTEAKEYVWASEPDPVFRALPDLPPNGKRRTAATTPPDDASLRKFLENPPNAYCGRNRNGKRDKFRWKQAFGLDELTRIVGEKNPVGRVTGIEIVARGPSGRATELKIVGEKGEATVHRELPIRQALGGLSSGLFVIDTERDDKGALARMTFSGAGWGHGVGMCQSGAIGMAESKRRYGSILGHYFRGVRLRVVY